MLAVAGEPADDELEEVCQLGGVSRVQVHAWRPSSSGVLACGPPGRRSVKPSPCMPAPP